MEKLPKKPPFIHLLAAKVRHINNIGCLVKNLMKAKFLVFSYIALPVFRAIRICFEMCKSCKMVLAVQKMELCVDPKL